MVLFLVLLVSSCATRRGADPGAAGAVAIQVRKDLVPSATMSISAVTRTGTRTLLGSVLPGGEQTFSYAPGAAGEHHVVADPPDPGSELVSRPILSSAPGRRIEWRLGSNSVLPVP